MVLLLVAGADVLTGGADATLKSVTNSLTMARKYMVWQSTHGCAQKTWSMHLSQWRVRRVILEALGYSGCDLSHTCSAEPRPCNHSPSSHALALERKNSCLTSWYE